MLMLAGGQRLSTPAADEWCDAHPTTQRQRGASLVEYALLLVLVVLAGVAAMGTVRDALRDAFTLIASAF